MICRKCGNDIPDEAKFCGWCGARCGEKVCAACGAKLRSDQLFCHECGLKCDSGALQTAELLHGKPFLPAESYTSSVEDEMKTHENRGCRLTISRNFQAGSSDLVFKVYIDNRDLGNICAGESLSAVIFSEKVMIEIRHYANMPYEREPALKVRKSIVLTDMENPKISFRVSDSVMFGEGNAQYPKIEMIVSGATVLQQVQKML